MASSAIIWPIIPGIGLLYGGLANRKSSLALLWQSFMVHNFKTDPEDI
jgi:Amt family ammonium transporter